MLLNDVQENFDHLFFLHTTISTGRDPPNAPWEEQGFINDKILVVNQELDVFITEYQRIMMPVYKSHSRLRLVK